MTLPESFQFIYYKDYSPIYTAQLTGGTHARISWEDDPKHHINGSSTLYRIAIVQELIKNGNWIIINSFNIDSDEADFDMNSIL